MRGIFTLIGFALVVVAASGYYLDWYHIHSTSTSAGQQTITIDVNRNKVEQDLKKGEEKVIGAWQATNTNTPPPPAAPGTTLPPLPQGVTTNTPSSQPNSGLFNITSGKNGGIDLQINPPALPPLPPIFGQQPNK